MFDLMVGGGPSTEVELENAGGQIIDKASMIGLAATARRTFSFHADDNQRGWYPVGIYDVKAGN